MFFAGGAAGAFPRRDDRRRLRGRRPRPASCSSRRRRRRGARHLPPGQHPRHHPRRHARAARRRRSGARAARVFYKELLFVSFDRETARTLGYHVRRWDLLLYLTLGFVIAFAMQFAGVMLVFNFLVLPAVTGLLLAQHARRVLLVGDIRAPRGRSRVLAIGAVRPAVRAGHLAVSALVIAARLAGAAPRRPRVGSCAWIRGERIASAHATTPRDHRARRPSRRRKASEIDSPKRRRHTERALAAAKRGGGWRGGPRTPPRYRGCSRTACPPTNADSADARASRSRVMHSVPTTAVSRSRTPSPRGSRARTRHRPRNPEHGAVDYPDYRHGRARGGERSRSARDHGRRRGDRQLHGGQQNRRRARGDVLRRDDRAQRPRTQ